MLKIRVVNGARTISLRHCGLFLAVSFVAWLPHASAQEVELQELIRLMREHEQLYERPNEFEYTRVQSGHKLLEGWVAAHSMKSWRQDYRCVWQGEMFYCKYTDDIVNFDGSKKTMVSFYGYDGTLTRINSQGATGNICHYKTPALDWVACHQFGAPMFAGLSIADVMVGSPRYTQTDPRAANIAKVASTLVGDGSAASLTCKKVRTIALGNNNEELGVWLFYVCPSRNYLVARTEQFYTSADLHPVTVFEVMDWRELEPGMWYPSKCSGASYFETTSRNATLTVDYTVNQIRFDPDYPTSLFRNIEMPSMVHVLKGGQIVETLIDGVPEVKSSQPGWGRYRWLAFANAILLGVVILIVYIRRMRNRRASMGAQRPN